MKTALTPKQVARAIGVSEASLKRWCDKGWLPSVRTRGGHRRIARPDVIRFLRARGQPLARPELLGLPATCGRGLAVVDRAVAHARKALESGDDDRLRCVLLDLYLARQPVADIFDHVLGPAMRAMGARWQHGEIEIYQERRACEVCTRALHELRSIQSPPPPYAPHAIGATLAGDPYTLPTLMCEVVLREAGWRAESYGIGHPADTFCAAVKEAAPRLVWISVSSIADARTMTAGFNALYRAATAAGAALVVGGRALTELLRTQTQCDAFCDNMKELASFAATIHPTGASA